MRAIIFIILSLGLVLSSNCPVLAIYTSGEDENPSISIPVQDDAALAGNSVSISEQVFGELFALGNTIYVGKKAGRSIYAAGNSVTIDQGAGYNVLAGGNTVILNGEIGHDVYVGGNSVTLGEGTIIRGDLRVGAANLVLDGVIDGNVYFGGEAVTSKAVIGGEMKGEAQTLAFTGGTIGKDLVYYSSKEANGLDKVKVSGKTERSKARFTGKDMDKTEEFSILGLLFAGWVFSFFGTLLLGAILILLAPKKVTAVTHGVTKEWKQSFVAGLIAFIVFPLVAILAFTTLIGWQIALMLFAIYWVLLTIAANLGLIALGQYVLSKRSANPSWWLALVTGVVIVYLLKATPLIPLISVVVFIGLTLPAFGALLRWYRQHLA